MWGFCINFSNIHQAFTTTHRFLTVEIWTATFSMWILWFYYNCDGTLRVYLYFDARQRRHLHDVVFLQFFFEIIYTTSRASCFWGFHHIYVYHLVLATSKKDCFVNFGWSIINNECFLNVRASTKNHKHQDIAIYKERSQSFRHAIQKVWRCMLGDVRGLWRVVQSTSIWCRSINWP